MQWPKTGWPNFPLGAFLCQKTTVEHRYRQGTLHIIGTSQLDGIGSMKRWQTIAYSGGLTQVVYEPTMDGEGNVTAWCGSAFLTLSSTRSGTFVMAPNPAYPDGSNPIITDTSEFTGGVDGGGDESVMTTVYAETSVVTTGTGDCVYFYIDGWYRITTGSESMSLSQQYTAEMAVAHFQSYAPWGGWALGDGGPGIHAEWADEGSYIVLSSTPRFAYVDMEWRVTRTGLNPNTVYSCTMKAHRSPFGGGAYEYYADVIETATSDGSGTLVVVGQVPNDPGYETYVVGPPEIVEA